MLLEGGTVVFRQNEATTSAGGGVSPKRGHKLEATGNTQMTVESNMAGQVGGGLLSIYGADVLVEGGASVVFRMNEATNLDGGGVYQQYDGPNQKQKSNNTQMTL